MMTQNSRNPRMSSVESSGSNANQPTSSGVERKWKPFECRVNLPALLNDPTLPKRPLDIFAQIWGPEFERRAPNVRSLNGVSGSRGDKGTKPISEAYLNILERRKKKQNIPKPNTAIPTEHDVPRLFLSTEFNLEDAETFCAVFQLPLKNGRAAFDVSNQPGALGNSNTAATTTNRSRSRNNSGSQPLSPRSGPSISIAAPTGSNGAASTPTQTQSVIAHFRTARSTLHEQLAHHLDTVETRIVAHVSRKSSAFFSAIAAHDDVARTLERAALVTARLRAQLTAADRRAVAEPLRLARIEQRRARYARLFFKLKRVADVAQSQAMIQVLLSRNEYAGALELIEVTRDLLHGELCGLHCFRHLEPQFVELLRVILRMMQAEFVSVLQSALRRVVKQRSISPTSATGELNGQSPSENEAETETQPDAQLDAKLGALLLGLLATRSYYAESFATAGSDMLVTSPRPRIPDAPEPLSAVQSDTADAGASPARFRFVGWYRDECCSSIRASVKETVVTSLDDAAPRNIALSLNETLARVDADRSLTLLHDLLDTLRELVRRAAHVLRTFAATINEAEHKEQLEEAARREPLPADLDGDVDGDEDYAHVASNGERDASVDPATRVQPAAPTRSASFEEFACMRRALRNAFLHAATYAEERAAKVIQSQLSSVQQSNPSGNSNAPNVDTRWSLPQYLTLLDCVERYLSDVSLIVTDAVATIDSQALGTRERERHESSPPSVLMQCVRSLAGRFVARFHDDRRQKLGLILDSERWRPAEVPAEFQLLATHVSTTQQLTTLGNSSATSNSPTPVPSLPTTQNDAASLQTNALDSSVNGHSDSSTSAVLLLDGEEYTVVGTVLILFRMMCEYGEAAQQLNFAAHEFLSRLLDLLKLFNSRTCQLILGAGAVQVAQLKTITTRNLALASRCLQLVIRILPIARKHFAALLDAQHSVPHGSSGTSAALAANAATQLMRHTDSLRKDYDDHVGELANKIVCIMDATLQDSLAKWAPPFASASGSTPAATSQPSAGAASNSISTQVKMAAKQLLKMHETLVGILPDSQIAVIYRKVYNDCFMVLLRSKLQTLSPAQRTRDVVANVLQLDVTYLCDACKIIPFLKEVTFERVIDDLLAAPGNR